MRFQNRNFSCTKPLPLIPRKNTSMKKYFPHLLILACLIIMIIEFIQGEPFQYHISNILIIIAMLITIFESKKKENKENNENNENKESFNNYHSN